MNRLPEVRDGAIVQGRKKPKGGSKRPHIKAKKTKKIKLGRKLWKEYYESIEFIKHL